MAPTGEVGRQRGAFRFPMTHCDHKNIERKGRACYICKECGDDVTLYLVFLHEAEKPIFQSPPSGTQRPEGERTA